MSDAVDLEKALSAALGSIVTKRLAVLQQELLSELVKSLGGAVGGETATSGALNSAFQRISAARSQTEILQGLLEGTTSFCNRAALLVVKGERLTGWRARGLEGGSSDGLREIDLPAEGPNGWRKALAEQAATRETVEQAPEALARAFFDALGAPHDSRAYLLPVQVKERPVAALYADSGSAGKSLDLAALDLLARVTGMCLELSAIRGRPAAATAAAAAAPAPAAEVSVEPAAPPPEVVAAPAPAPEPELAREAAPAPAAAAAAAPAGAPRAPGPDLQNIPAAEHDIHKKAFRFAKLLVDDLVLYNKEKIQQAKEQRDVYGVLKEDIDKSRSAYGKKFSNTPAGKVDYFHQELMRRVAGEDTGVLGAEYPGPLV